MGFWGVGAGNPHPTQAGFFLGVFLRSPPHPSWTGFIDILFNQVLWLTEKGELSVSKIKKPLFSLESKGSLGRAISFVKRGGRSIVEKKPEVPDARTLAQLSWRHMYQKAVALWHALSAAEKEEWESLARPKHMTGFAWFVSQALKPNPGLYLPLQGGKMQGDIDMDGFKIEDLPDPAADQDAATKKYHDDNLPAGAYTEGCKVYRSTDQSIPNATFTYLIFNRKDFDTDEMHDLVVNPERITCRTAGVYLIIFHGYFDQNAVGSRRVYFQRNGFTIFQSRKDAIVNNRTHFNTSTIEQLTVGQYIRVRVYQNSGAPLDIGKTSTYSPYFMAQRIG